MRRRFSGPGAALASATLFLGLVIAVAGVAPAGAAPAKAVKPSAAATEPVRAPAAMPQPKAAYSQAGPDDAAGCFSARKKLFVDGEGWIVRRVTTCR
jgi:hypothetical protein